MQIYFHDQRNCIQIPRAVHTRHFLPEHRDKRSIQQNSHFSLPTARFGYIEMELLEKDPDCPKLFCTSSSWPLTSSVLKLHVPLSLHGVGDAALAKVSDFCNFQTFKLWRTSYVPQLPHKWVMLNVNPFAEGKRPNVTLGFEQGALKGAPSRANS